MASSVKSRDIIQNLNNPTMQTIIFIVIAVALAMTCCFLYVHKRELETANRMLTDANKELKEKDELRRSMYTEAKRDILDVILIQPDHYEIQESFFGCSAIAVWESINIRATVKDFHAQDNDGYERQCAEELIDKLKEKI